MAFRHALELRLGRKIRLGFAKRRDVDRAQRCERLQKIVRADLVAAIGRKWNPMGYKKRLSHQASPRATNGPSRLASGKGKRFQRSILAAWEALVGSTSRASAPGAVHVA